METTKEIKLKEVLANTLFATGDNAEVDTWRSDGDVRNAYRRIADEFLESLTEAGLRVSVKNSKKVDEALETIITVPAVHAYTLDELGLKKSPSSILE